MTPTARLLPSSDTSLPLGVDIPARRFFFVLPSPFEPPFPPKITSTGFKYLSLTLDGALLPTRFFWIVSRRF